MEQALVFIVEIALTSFCSVLFPSTLDSSLAPAFFSTLLPLGSELVALFHKELKLVNIFQEFFHACMILAGMQGGNGHLVLAKAAVSWLPEW